MLEIKFLHRVRVHLKVPGCFSDLNALLTGTLPMFLLRLNEISVEFLIMTSLTARFCGW